LPTNGVFMTKLRERKLWIIGLLFSFAVIIIFMLVFKHGSHDVNLYFSYAESMRLGIIPYRDISVEYTPLALLLFFLPAVVTALFSSGDAVLALNLYSLFFAIEMTLFAVAGVWLVIEFAKILKFSPVVALFCYLVVIIAIGEISVLRFDFAPAIITMTSLLFLCRRKYEVAWIILAIGVMTKIYPIVLVPIFIIFQLEHARRAMNRKDMERVALSAAVFMVTILLIAMPAVIVDAKGFLESFTMQSGRELHIESIYASVLLLLSSMGIGEIAVEYGEMAVEVFSPAAEFFRTVSFPIMAIVLGIVYFLFYRHQRIKDSCALVSPHESCFDVLRYGATVIAVFMITNKVFSPQFIIWLCPFVPLVFRRWRIAGWTIFVVIAFLTWFVYPKNYSSLVIGNPLTIGALVMRNVLMIILIVLLLAHSRLGKVIEKKNTEIPQQSCEQAKPELNIL